MSKNSKTTAKNHWKLEVRGTNIEARRGPEGVWDTSSAVLSVLDHFFGVVGGSWVRLVGHRTPILAQLGSQDGAQIA